MKRGCGCGESEKKERKKSEKEEKCGMPCFLVEFFSLPLPRSSLSTVVASIAVASGGVTAAAADGT